MLNRKMIVGTLTVFATLMVFGVIVFGILMQDFYLANQGDLVVRPQGEELMGTLAIGELIMSYAFVWIWKHDVKDDTINQGLRFGFFMGLFWSTAEILNYAFLPMELNVMVVGFILDVLMFMLAGVALSVVWSKMPD